jgi:hypothetical protein
MVFCQLVEIPETGLDDNSTTKEDDNSPNIILFLSQVETTCDT